MDKSYNYCKLIVKPTDCDYRLLNTTKVNHSTMKHLGKWRISKLSINKRFSRVTFGSNSSFETSRNFDCNENGLVYLTCCNCCYKEQVEETYIQKQVEQLYCNLSQYNHL